VVAVIDTELGQVRIDAGVVSSPNSALSDLVEDLKGRVSEFSYHPDCDLALAELAASTLGGVVTYEEPPSDGEEGGAVY